ncbi:MAG: hypothetical protein QOD74_3011, partial [Variibacter sp.]|nr:hypothetical protein [Variibacter sp.]
MGTRYRFLSTRLKAFTIELAAKVES